MRILLTSLAVVLACAARPAAAQGTRATAAANAQNRLALSESRPEASPRRMRLACAPLTGQVFEANGRPLLGATLLVKGTHQVYVTDAEGKFRITDVVYQGQELTIGAAGYVTQDVALEDCTLPRLVLAKDPTAHIRRNGKRAGQLIRLDGKSVDMK
ncbi:carboxypeptidase-like regulatory domain-containing protein [Hymenobacter sp. DH14]|uniref:Carboxypeptidase-like regulatory domain-containing protein n=1 Tax=Hymenobacter cyanobacteriorum TaxID=2926463 RepID=A0A9X1VI86_9BACT|nr:carboxypeptidase-like regulatory domain-containing protein [Hymenobacter cyanobacteriorum]MCI1188762.1 carboxypeptidase-like regulatory domain-containing protein [Hymenobacter cyanobacteriorum]